MKATLLTINNYADSIALECSPIEFLVLHKAVDRSIKDTEFPKADREVLKRIDIDMYNREQVERTNNGTDKT